MPEPLTPTSPCVLDENCLLRRTFDLVADRWTPTVLFLLSFGPKRYGDLHRGVPDLSKKMLTQTLREAVRNGLVDRRAEEARPRLAEYRLTALGEKALEPIRLLAGWARENEETLVAVAAARRNALRNGG